MLPELNKERQRLLRWASAGLAAVDSERRTADALAPLDYERAAVLAIGKAAGGMGRGAECALGDRLVSGFLVAPSAAESPLSPRWQRHVGDHPVPGERSLAAGRALREWCDGLEPGLPLLVLLSGGGSALVELPVEGVGAGDLERMNRWLLGSGLDIHLVNTVRARFSLLKRGGLLAMAGKRDVKGFAISDVPGDRVESIASGPLSPQSTEWPDVLMPEWLLRWHEALPMPPRYRQQAAVEVIARNDELLDAVALAAKQDGVDVMHRDALRGDAVECAGRILLYVRGADHGLWLFGGETTVRLSDTPGRGGRNQHLALAAALEMQTGSPMLLLALATDGIDGNSDDAGALVDNGTLARIADAGLDARHCLAAADSGTALAASGDIVHTGPTGTNVADVVIAWKP